MEIAGIVILVCVGLYLLFVAADGLALTNQTDSAKVAGKTQRAASEAYYTELINGRPAAVRRTTPEAYVLQLALDGREIECPVSLVLYNATKEGDQVNITYQRRRITGVLRVLDVSR